MSSQEMIHNINDAIGAHGAWKLKLKTAITTGNSDSSPHKIGCDDLCEFGKWLYGSSIPEEMKQTKPYEVIKRLHADFHRTAGVVLQYAVNDETSVAEEIMAGSFNEKSSILMTALNKWKAELARE